MAWLSIICLFPYLGIPLYLIFSGRKFKTRLKDKGNIYEGARLEKSQGSVISALGPVEKILQASGCPEAKGNKNIELLPTGVKAFDTLLKMIGDAKNSIHITTFIFGKDEVGRAVVNALTEKVASGIEVKILVDSLGATWVRHPSFAQFQKAGGQIAYFMPLLHLPFKGRTNLRNHRKLMVVDQTRAIVGGMNLAKEYLGPEEDPNRWIDLGVKIEGPSARDLEHIFAEDWAYATRQFKAKEKTLENLNELGAIQGQVVASGPDVVGDPLYDVLLSGIFEATRSIRIVTPYFIPDDALTKALELAAKRGVEVSVITPLKSNHRLADLARGSFLRQLQNVGAKILFFPKMIHAKAVVIDDKFAVLGSANFDMRSLLLNFEVGLIIYSPEVLKAVSSWINEKESQASEKVLKVGYWRDLSEGVGRVIGPLI